MSYAKTKDLSFGFVSLDQEKAFDRVDHKYLLEALNAFGFGPKFVSYIKLQYNEVYSLLKLNGGLTRLFPVNRGIRQGCSLSELLYSIVLKTLLEALRKQLHGILVPGPRSGEKLSVKLTAYADDVTVIITSNLDVRKLNKCLHKLQGELPQLK